MIDERRRCGRRVTAAEFSEEWFRVRTEELREKPRMHRKVWEFAAIAQVYHDQIEEGGRVLGFGVGREPLPAWFASRDAQVVATDRPEPGCWTPDQHARGLAELRNGGICRPEDFRARVSFREVDMLSIPGNLGGFDLTWSTSCFEHLGSIEAGLRFFCEQMRCLKPGGLAVHVTEFNAESDDRTIEERDLVVFRRRDLEELKRRLATQGDELWPLDLTPGTGPEDGMVDEAPYRMEPHLSLRLVGHVLTSVLLMASRGGVR